MSRLYLGFRFYSGRSTTTGSPHPLTGRYSKAGELVGFESKEKLNQWLNGERLSAPCGCDGGERIAVTKNEARNLFLGESVEDFEREIEMSREELQDE